MRQRAHYLLTVLAALVPLAARAVDLGNPLPNYDGTRSTQYPLGDKPPAGGPPVCAGIPDQAWSQSQAISALDTSDYCNDTQALTYGASGLPTGLSIDSGTGIISGTPSSAGSGTATVTATDTDTNQDSDAFDWTVTAANGSVFTIPTSGGSTTALRTYNCGSSSGANGAAWSTIRSSGSNSRPLPGDTIVLAGGTHNGRLAITDVVGTAASRITIRNDTSAGSPATIVTTSTSLNGFAGTDWEYVTLDGLGGWSGQAADRCGHRGSGVYDTAGCGIRIDATTQNAFQLNGRRRNITVRGVEVDGNWPGDGTLTGADVGVSLNDSTYCQDDHPGEWVEDIVLERMYVHDTAKEAMYLGPNVTSTAGSCGEVGGLWNVLRLRDIRVDDNLVSNGGWDGIELKSAKEGTNSVSRNKVTSIGGGAAGSGANSRAISIYESGGVTVERNIVDTTSAPPGGAPGIVCSLQFAPTNWCGNVAGDVCQCDVRGNVVRNADGNGIAYVRSSGADEQITGTIEYNTVTQDDDHDASSCINIPSDVATTGIVRHNIGSRQTGTCPINDGAFFAPSGSNTNAAWASQGFTNAATGDVTLTSGSGNRDSGGSDCAGLTDIAGTSRPVNGVCDRGAYERP